MDAIGVFLLLLSFFFFFPSIPNELFNYFGQYWYLNTRNGIRKSSLVLKTFCFLFLLGVFISLCSSLFIEFPFITIISGKLAISHSKLLSNSLGINVKIDLSVMYWLHCTFLKVLGYGSSDWSVRWETNWEHWSSNVEAAEREHD